MTDIEQKVKQYITAGNLMCAGGHYIATLSGGPDSVAMLVLLVRMGYEVEACHCNFHLRGSEADRDEAYCRELCSNMNIPLHVVHFDTYGYADSHKVSIEMAARELRYGYFEQLRKELNADGICVAHHINDTAETLIMNLIRGTGIRGLKGISARNGYIIRPLLCVTRHEIEDFLNKEHIESVTDSSNLVNDVTRNRIRLDIIPLMENINGSAVMNVARTAHRIDEALKVFDDAMARTMDYVRISRHEYSIDRLMKTPSPEYTLFTILEEYGFTPAQTEAIYNNIKASSGTEYVSHSHRILFDRGRLLVRPVSEEMPEDLLIMGEGTYHYSETLSLVVAKHAITPEYKIKRSRNTASVDISKITFPLKLRNVKEGDRFVPFGMKGSKLLSDYMTDRKFSLFKKRQQTVVTDATEKIVWVTGERPDARFCITKDTKEVLEIEVMS